MHQSPDPALLRPPDPIEVLAIPDVCAGWVAGVEDREELQCPFFATIRGTGMWNGVTHWVHGAKISQ
jgi:hypothetical protein